MYFPNVQLYRTKFVLKERKVVLTSPPMFGETAWQQFTNDAKESKQNKIILYLAEHNIYCGLSGKVRFR